MTANKPLSAATNRQKLKTVGIHTTPESRDTAKQRPAGPHKGASHPPRIDGWIDRNLGLRETQKTLAADNQERQ